MIMRRFFLLLSIALFFCCGTLKAEEFVPKRASIENNGQKIEVKDLSKLPVFSADYYRNEDVVKISSSAGHLTLKKGNFCYSCRGMRNGLLITATAYVSNGKIEKIVYEEWDRAKNAKAILYYYKK